MIVSMHGSVMCPRICIRDEVSKNKSGPCFISMMKSKSCTYIYDLSIKSLFRTPVTVIKLFRDTIPSSSSLYNIEIVELYQKHPASQNLSGLYIYSTLASSHKGQCLSPGAHLLTMFSLICFQSLWHQKTRHKSCMVTLKQI